MHNTLNMLFALSKAKLPEWDHTVCDNSSWEQVFCPNTQEEDAFDPLHLMFSLKLTVDWAEIHVSFRVVLIYRALVSINRPISSPLALLCKRSLLHGKGSLFNYPPLRHQHISTATPTTHELMMCISSCYY